MGLCRRAGLIRLTGVQSEGFFGLIPYRPTELVANRVALLERARRAISRHMQTGHQLSAADLSQARRAYEAGETFEAVDERFGLSATSRMLVTVGVVPRPRGVPAVKIPPLGLEDLAHAPRQLPARWKGY
jgi:hypothetical protein